MISRCFQLATGRVIKLPKPTTEPLTADWDCERLRCWPTPSSAAYAELLVAKAMCTAFAVAVGLIVTGLQVIA